MHLTLIKLFKKLFSESLLHFYIYILQYYIYIDIPRGAAVKKVVKKV